MTWQRLQSWILGALVFLILLGAMMGGAYGCGARQRPPLENSVSDTSPPAKPADKPVDKPADKPAVTPVDKDSDLGKAIAKLTGISDTVKEVKTSIGGIKDDIGKLVPKADLVNSISAVATRLSALEDKLAGAGNTNRDQIIAAIKTELEARDALYKAALVAAKEKASLERLLKSRAYIAYRERIEHFQRQHRERIDDANARFTMNLADNLDEASAQRLRQAQARWVEQETMEHEKFMEHKLKAQLRRFYGFSKEEIRQLERLDKAD